MRIRMKPESKISFNVFGRELRFRQRNEPANNFENWQYDFAVLLHKKQDRETVKFGLQFSILVRSKWI